MSKAAGASPVLLEDDVMPANNYRQVRLTMTEESGGRLQAHLHVKPALRPWNQNHLVWRKAWRMSDPPVTLLEVLQVLQDVLQEARQDSSPSE